MNLAMHTPIMEIVPLSCIPTFDGVETVLVRSTEGPSGDYIAQRPQGDASADSLNIVAFIDDASLNVYALKDVGEAKLGAENSVAPDVEMAYPLVRFIGETSDATGQVTIRQPAGNYRRYSRWDKVTHRLPNHPNAIVRTLPQCGCGGYLGTPMFFDSFADMMAYFYTVFFYMQGDDTSCLIDISEL